MKRIKITVQPVQRGLRSRRLFLNNSICLTFWRLVRSRSRPSIYLSFRKGKEQSEQPQKPPTTASLDPH